MVSLRTNLWQLRQSAALVAGLLILLLGSGLTAATVSGRIWRGSSALESAANGELQSYVASLRRGTTPFNLADANHKVFVATRHSDDRRIALTENWLQWSLGHVYAPLARTQNAELLMASARGDCSERSQILKTLAEDAGHRCRFAGLSGHVVLEVETARRWQVADPDYGVVFPLGIETLQRPQAEPLIRSTLARSSYPPATIELYLSIVQSAKDNVVMPVGSPLSPRLAVVERWCERLALPLPLGMILCGVALLFGYRRRRASQSARGRRELPGPTDRGWSWAPLPGGR
jgi:hypothetical protein